MNAPWQDYRSKWFNYQTSSYEENDKPLANFTDDDAMKYIPAIPAAHGLYDIYRLMDKTVVEAMRLVLERCAGIKSE